MKPLARVAAAAHRHMTSAFPLGALRAAAEDIVTAPVGRLREGRRQPEKDSDRRVRDATILVFDRWPNSIVPACKSRGFVRRSYRQPIARDAVGVERPRRRPSAAMLLSGPARGRKSRQMGRVAYRQTIRSTTA